MTHHFYKLLCRPINEVYRLKGLAAHNSTFAIGGFSCSADSLVVAESFVLRINFSGKNPAHRKSEKRYSKCEDK